MKLQKQNYANELHGESQKGANLTMAIYNFVNDLQNSFTAAKNTKFPTKPILDYPPHLKYVCVLLDYVGKLKNQEYALCMHVKHVSSVTFYHLSNRYLPNVMKISAKINTMQNINILLLVRLLSLTN